MIIKLNKTEFSSAIQSGHVVETLLLPSRSIDCTGRFSYLGRRKTELVARQGRRGQDVAVLGTPTLSAAPASAPQGRTFRKHGSM